MHAAWSWFLNFIRKPEWVAAVALLIQAVILWLQARILRKHGHTMEEHAGIAKKQAETAKLIGQALQQHATILAQQSDITKEQYDYQRRIESHTAREEIYDHLLRLDGDVQLLIFKIESPGTRDATRMAEEAVLQGHLVGSVIPVQKATITSLYLTDEEREYFRRYTMDLAATLLNPLNGNVRLLKDFREKYKDILTMTLKIAQHNQQSPPSRKL